jgi:hypothetical protein
MLALVFLIVALVLFIIAAIGIPTGRWSLIAAGLAFWVGSHLVGKL